MKKATFFQLLASLASALFLALLWEPFRQSQAAFFALVPLLLLIRFVSPKRAFWWGCLTGFLSWVVQLSWMWKLTDNDGPWILVIPALVGLSFYLSLYAGCFAALAARIRRLAIARVAFVRILLVVLVEPILWVGFELLRSTLFSGFAWNPLGLVCTDYLWIAQLAAVGGVSFVSAVVVAVNGGVATIFERVWQSMTHTLPTTFFLRAAQSLESFLPLAFFAGSFLWGYQRIKTYTESEHALARIAVQYTDVPSIFTGKATEAPWEMVSDRVEKMALFKPDLWLWPESAAGGPYSSTQLTYAEVKLKQLAAQADTPLLMGGTYVDGAQVVNAAMLITGAHGIDHQQIYAKRHLVPFGEYIPLDNLIPALKRFVPTGISLTAGEDVTTVTLPNHLKIGPLICFEDTVAAVARQSVNDGARLLVNMSNDAWYAPSFEAEQHARQAVMRCIETGTPMVRSTNRGQNTVIDAVGRSIPIDPNQFPTFVPLTERPYALAYLTYGERIFGAPCIFITLCLAALFLVRCCMKKTTITVLLILVALPIFAETPLIPMAEMAIDDGNISLAESTAKKILATLGVTPAERAAAQEVLIRSDLAKEQWQAVMDRVEASPELPASHRLVFRLAAYNGLKQYAKTQEEYAAAKLATDDAWGVAALRLALQADLALGTTLRATQHFDAIDKAKGATDQMRAENALAWHERFPNDASRAALLRSATKATEGAVYLTCAMALPKAFATANNRQEAFMLVDKLLDDTTLDSTTRAQLAFASVDFATTPEQKIAYARRAVKVARVEEVRFKALARLGNLLCDDHATAEEGIVYLKDAVRLNPSSPEAPLLQLRIAEMLQALKKMDDALRAYDHYLSSYDVPALRVRVRQGKARTLMAANRPDEALATFAEAMDWATDGAVRNELLGECAEAAMVAKRYTRAVTLYRELQGKAPSPEVLLRLAFALEAAGETNEARTHYAILRNDSKATSDIQVLAVLHLGKLYADEERHQEALAEYSKALSHAKGLNRERLLLARGRAYYALGKLDRAQEDVAFICDSKDENVAADARFFMVLSLYGLGEDERAREFARAYVAAYPDSPRLPDIFLWIAKSDFNRGDYDAACAGFESFGERWKDEPRVPQSLFLAARAAYQDQNYMKVVELVGRLAKDYPQALSLSDARFLQAEALMELARHAEARELLSALILRYPNAVWIGEAYGRLGDCLFTTATDDPERAVQALEAYREAVTRLEFDPDNTLMYLYKIGRVLEKQNRRDDAAEQYSKLIYRVLNHPSIYSVVGLRWMEKAMMQLQAIERARGNFSAFETLRRRVHAAKIPGLILPQE